MNKSDQLDLLATALAVAQGQIKNASKDSKNPFFKSAYSTLTSVRDSLQAPFTKHGLAVTQLLGNDPHGLLALLVYQRDSPFAVVELVKKAV